MAPRIATAMRQLCAEGIEPQQTKKLSQYAIYIIHMVHDMETHIHMFHIHMCLYMRHLISCIAVCVEWQKTVDESAQPVDVSAQ